MFMQHFLAIVWALDVDNGVPLSAVYLMFCLPCSFGIGAAIMSRPLIAHYLKSESGEQHTSFIDQPFAGMC